MSTAASGRLPLRLARLGYRARRSVVRPGPEEGLAQLLDGAGDLHVVGVGVFMSSRCCAGESGAVSAVGGVTAVAMGSVSGRVIPPLTVRMARASNARGTAAMWVCDRLDGLFTDADFADWYPANGRRGLSPAQLALVSVLRYAENVTDRQAADAV